MKPISPSEILRSDLSSGLVVFLVALPLCLGIAMASAAPLFAGIITGAVAGIVVGLLSGSHISVSGPAAGLTVIVEAAIFEMDTYEAFLLAVFVAGILQIIFGFAKAGIIALFFPYSVIRGMLTAIGLILLVKQLPVAVGDDILYEEIRRLLNDLFLTIRHMDFQGPTLTDLFHDLYWTFTDFQPSSVFISTLSLLVLYFWDKPFFQKYKFFKLVPGPLVVVLGGIAINEAIFYLDPAHYLVGTHRVSLPVADSFDEFSSFFVMPDFSAWKNPAVYKVGFTIALIAGIETLLSIEASDKMDKLKRVTPPNRELKAQGVGNVVAALLGGIPMTSVIVRSSANVNAGAVSKFSAVFHGLLLAGTVMLIPNLLNLIPLASLAAVLIRIGYKLTRIEIYKNMYKLGSSQFVPFLVTVAAVFFTDLLTGIGIGILVALFYLLKVNYQLPFACEHIENENEKDIFKIKLSNNVSFLIKATLQRRLSGIPDDCHVIIDASESDYIDYDVLEIIVDFIESADSRQITYQLININNTDIVMGTH